MGKAEFHSLRQIALKSPSLSASDINFRMNGNDLYPNVSLRTTQRYIHHVHLKKCIPKCSLTATLWTDRNLPIVLDWTPYSPDLSPIENVWAVLQKQLAKKNSRNFVAFSRNIVELWNNFPADFGHQIMKTMNWRIRRCLELNGDVVDISDYIH